jgi:hypothetical protein
VTEMIERICRAKAAKHYAKRFGKPETDRHVLVNVDSNWNIFENEVRETIEAMRDLPEEPGPRYTAGEYSRRTQESMVDDALGVPRIP